MRLLLVLAALFAWIAWRNRPRYGLEWGAQLRIWRMSAERRTSCRIRGHRWVVVGSADVEWDRCSRCGVSTEWRSVAYNEPSYAGSSY